MGKFPPIEAIIFDMDGTLTVPVLDFDRIRSEIGLPAGPILESLLALAAGAAGEGGGDPSPPRGRRRRTRRP